MCKDSSSDLSKYEFTMLDGEPEPDLESSILFPGDDFVLLFCFI